MLEITARPARFGTTSFTLAFELRRAGEPEVLVTAECVYVAIEPKAWKSRPLTQQERDFLKRGAIGKVVDHAGYLKSQARA